MAMICNPDAEKAPFATMTVLEVGANHEGETHEFFQRIRDSFEEDHDGSDYARDNGAYHILHASECTHLADKLKKANVHLEGSLSFALGQFVQALAQHAVIFELHYPDGFKCRLQFV